MNTWKPIAAMLAVLMTAGCVKVWQDHLDIRTYLLQVNRDAPAAEAPLADKLWIEPVNVLPPYNVRNLITRKSDVEFTASYYTEMMVSPADNFRSCFYTWLFQSGLFGQVSVADRTGMSHSLIVSVMEFYVDESQSKAILKIKATLLDERNRDNRLLFSNEYNRETPVEEMNVDGIMRAYNTDLAAILADLEQDIAAVLAHPAEKDAR